MHSIIPPDPAALNRRASTVEADPGAGSVVLVVDRVRHRLAADEARQLGRALLLGAMAADPAPALHDDDEMDDADMDPGF